MYIYLPGRSSNAPAVQQHSFRVCEMSLRKRLLAVRLWQMILEYREIRGVSLLVAAPALFCLGGRRVDEIDTVFLTEPVATLVRDVARPVGHGWPPATTNFE